MISQISCIGEPQPKTWDDYERGCLSTFHAGYGPDEGDFLRAYQGGMRTVFSLLREEFPQPGRIAALERRLAKLVEAAEEYVAVSIPTINRIAYEARETLCQAVKEAKQL